MRLRNPTDADQEFSYGGQTFIVPPKTTVSAETPGFNSLAIQHYAERYSNKKLEVLEEVDVTEELDYDLMKWDDLRAYAHEKGFKSFGVTRVELTRQLREYAQQ